MTILGLHPQSVPDRLHRRLRQRYLRWLARQPVTSVFLSEGWRAFWRGYRRGVNAFGRNRLVLIPAICIGVCMLLVFLGGVVASIAFMVGGPPVLLFAPPGHHPFASLAQRDAVALTRLTILQSTILPFLFLWATRCFHNSSGLETHTFYEKYRSSELRGYRVGFLYFLACSAAVVLGASIGHDTAVSGVVASLTVTGCLGWLAWTAAKRLMAIRCPLWLSSREALPATFLLFPLLLMPLLVGLCCSPAVITVSPHLKWLGPLGWVNDLLLGLSFGDAQNAWPLGIGCVVALSVGYWANRPTSSWTFRRQLLAKYRTPRVSRPQAATRTTGEPCLARDLRQSLSEGGWKPTVYPRWMKGHVTSLLVVSGMAFLTQLFLAGLVLFLESVERQIGSGTTLNEKQAFSALLACAGGWNVLAMEGLAALLRDQLNLVEFARRPISPGQVWRQLQLQGVQFAPAQILLAIPFVAFSTVVAPGYFMNSCLAVVVALLACIAIRTALSAGSCYFPSIAHLREWMAAILVALGAVAGIFLIGGTAVSSVYACAVLDWTPGERVLVLLLQQIATLTALGIAWGVWHAVGYTGKQRSDDTHTS